MKSYGWINFVNTKLNPFILTQILLALLLAPIHNRFASLPRKIHTSNISISVITGLQSWRYWTSPWNKKNDKLIKYNTYKRFLLENTGYITNVPQRPCTCCHRFEQATIDVFCKVDGIYLYCFCYVHVFNNETWQKSNINKYIFRRRVKN